MKFSNTKLFKLCLVIVSSVCVLIPVVESFKFLVVLHFSSKSHFIIGSALLRGLTNAGHEVTVVSPFPLDKPMENYHDVPVTGVLEVVESKLLTYSYLLKYCTYLEKIH